MGGKDPKRQPRLRSIRETPDGWIRLAICQHCGHRGPLPAEQLIKKFGELVLVEFAMVGLRCTACRKQGTCASMIRLCDQSCPKQSG